MQTKTSNALNGIEKLLIVIAAIGAINWGLIGFFNWNLVTAIFGGGARATEMSTVSRVIYAIIGVCGVGSLALLPTLRRPRAEEAAARRTEVYRSGAV